MWATMSLAPSSVTTDVRHGWNVVKRRDNEDLQRLLESRHLDFWRQQAISATLMDSSEVLVPKKKPR